MKACPNDFEFASYLRTLERAGVSKEHMETTGLLAQVEERKRLTHEDNSLSSAFKSYLPVNEVNLKMLTQIEELEHLGQKPEEIIATLNIPDTILMKLQLGLLVPDINTEVHRKK